LKTIVKYALVTLFMHVSLAHLMRFRKSMYGKWERFCLHVCSRFLHTKGKNGNIELGHWVTKACVSHCLHVD